jgi:hypothetical protein
LPSTPACKKQRPWSEIKRRQFPKARLNSCDSPVVFVSYLTGGIHEEEKKASGRWVYILMNVGLAEGGAPAKTAESTRTPIMRARKDEVTETVGAAEEEGGIGSRKIQLVTLIGYCPSGINDSL